MTDRTASPSNSSFSISSRRFSQRSVPFIQQRFTSRFETKTVGSLRKEWMRSCNRLNSDPKLVLWFDIQTTDRASIGKRIFQAIIEEMEVFSHGRLESTVECRTSDTVLSFFLSSRQVRIASIPFTGIPTETRDQRLKIRIDRFVFSDEIGLQQRDVTWHRLEDGDETRCSNGFRTRIARVNQSKNRIEGSDNENRLEVMARLALDRSTKDRSSFSSDTTKTISPRPPHWSGDRLIPVDGGKISLGVQRRNSFLSEVKINEKRQKSKRTTEDEGRRADDWICSSVRSDSRERKGRLRPRIVSIPTWKKSSLDQTAWLNFDWQKNDVQTGLNTFLPFFLSKCIENSPSNGKQNDKDRTFKPFQHHLLINIDDGGQTIERTTNSTEIGVEQKRFQRSGEDSEAEHRRRFHFEDLILLGSNERTNDSQRLTFERLIADRLNVIFHGTEEQTEDGEMFASGVDVWMADRRIETRRDLTSDDQRRRNEVRHSWTSLWTCHFTKIFSHTILRRPFQWIPCSGVLPWPALGINRPALPPQRRCCPQQMIEIVQIDEQPQHARLTGGHRRQEIRLQKRSRRRRRRSGMMMIVFHWTGDQLIYRWSIEPKPRLIDQQSERKKRIALRLQKIVNHGKDLSKAKTFNWGNYSSTILIWSLTNESRRVSVKTSGSRKRFISLGFCWVSGRICGITTIVSLVALERVLRRVWWQSSLNDLFHVHRSKVSLHSMASGEETNDQWKRPCSGLLSSSGDRRLTSTSLWTSLQGESHWAKRLNRLERTAVDWIGWRKARRDSLIRIAVRS